MIYESAEELQAYKQKIIDDVVKKTMTSIVPGQEKIDVTPDPNTDSAITSAQVQNQGMIKRFIPYYIYKPPFGFPRRDIDLINCRRLARTPFVFSVIKTLLDEITSAKWDILPNEGFTEDEVKEDVKSIKEFINNPNDNNESFRSIIRAVVRDIFEIDSGVIEKVYNRKGELVELYTIDGSTMLINPDEHGSIRNRLDYVPVMYTRDLESNQAQISAYYNNYLKETAAYFQYNWTGGIWPIPFGKKEIVYIKANDSSDSIYGTSPVQVLYNIILTLVYAAQVNLDMYANNNTPTGIISVMDGNKAQLDAMRTYFNNLTMERDIYGNNRKKYFNVPITSTEAKYVDFGMNAKEMQMIEQQKWYQELVYQTFGVTLEEMGITENSNRSTSNESSRIFKRKALAPMFKLLEYHLNTQIIWELNPEKKVVFKYDDYDIEQEFRKAELNEKLLNSTWTLNEIRQKDNMEKIEGEEYDKPKSQSSMFGNSFDNQLDKLDKDGEKKDITNNERSPEKQDKSNEDNEDNTPTKKKTLDEDVPKVTELEKELLANYKKIEKQIVGMIV